MSIGHALLVPALSRHYDQPRGDSGGSSGPSLPASNGLLAVSLARRVVAGWTSPILLARRDSDDAEDAFGVDGNGDLDVASMLSWGGAASVFAVTGYDQFGNSNDLSQSDKTKQPILAASGSLVSQWSGKPTPNFSSSRSLQRSDALGLTGAPALTMAHVSYASSIAGYPMFCSIGRHPSTATAQTIYVHLANELSASWSYLATRGNGPNFTLTAATSGRRGYVGRIAASARIDATTLRQDGADQTQHSVAGNGALTLSLPNENVSWGGGAGPAAGDLRDFAGYSNFFAIYNAVLTGSDLTALEAVQAVH